MKVLEGVRVFYPEEGSQRYQMSMDCLELIRDTVGQAVEEAVREAVPEAIAWEMDSVAQDTTRDILQAVEDVAATGQLGSVEEVCDFLRDYFDLWT